MSSLKKQIKKLPLYPLLPFGPLVIVGSLLAFQTFLFARLRRLTRSVDALAGGRASVT
jgi:hypothetical protein